MSAIDWRDYLRQMAHRGSQEDREAIEAALDRIVLLEAEVTRAAAALAAAAEIASLTNRR